ncbi:unnamed protein product [Urochloa humidicola]
MYHVLVLKRGFKDKAISLHFSAILLVGYAQFSRIIENSENRLIELELKAGHDGDSEVAWRARVVALSCIRMIKMLLKIFSSGEIEELRAEADELRTRVKGILKNILDLSSENRKLTEVVKLLQLENSKLKEEMKLIQSEIEGLKKNEE